MTGLCKAQIEFYVVNRAGDIIEVHDELNDAYRSLESAPATFSIRYSLDALREYARDHDLDVADAGIEKSCDADANERALEAAMLGETDVLIQEGS